MNRIVLNNIYSDILEISDIELQKSYWLGRNKEHISSYVEVMNRLFDDSDFNNFVDNEVYRIGLDYNTMNQLRILRNMLIKYKEKDTDLEIIQDLKWQEISEQAKLVINLWQKEEI